ncbi:hypothetical protein EV128_101269 [Rhizobium azibense]|nr:hypothetical protein EV128_101269 [Rhizobium azibense]
MAAWNSVLFNKSFVDQHHVSGARRQAASFMRSPEFFYL